MVFIYNVDKHLYASNSVYFHGNPRNYNGMTTVLLC